MTSKPKNVHIDINGSSATINADTPQLPATWHGNDIFDYDRLTEISGLPKNFGIPRLQIEVSKQCLQYAIKRFDARRISQIANMNNLYDKYNGILGRKNYEWITKRYGINGPIKFVDWQLGKTKINLMLGEYVDRPLNSTIYSLNKQMLSEKLDHYHLALGKMSAEESAERIKKATGVDVFEGMPSFNGSKEDLWKILNAKSRTELIMQIILNDVIKKEDFKTKFIDGKLDSLLTNESFSKVYIDAYGLVRFRKIDPRDAMFEEIDDDYFLEKSPYLGERRLMFEHQIYANWPVLNSTREYRDAVRKLFMHEEQTQSTAISARRRNYIYNLNNRKGVETFTIEWVAEKPLFTIFKKDKENNVHANTISTEFLNNNYDRIQYDIKKGAEVDMRYKQSLFTATQIGANIFVDCKEAENMICNVSNPYYTTTNYSGFLFDTHDGIRVSAMEQMDHLSELYNVVMYMIRRDVYKSKGKVIPYDRSMLPAKTTMKEVIHRLVDEGIYDYNSASEANRRGDGAQRLQNMLREIDLGVSESISRLLEIKREIEATADKLTGINENREGQIAASSTATNANNSIRLSRTITLHRFYMYNRYNEIVLRKAIEHAKNSYCNLRPDIAEELISKEDARFLKELQEVDNDGFGLYLADAGKEVDVRQRLQQIYIPGALQKQELRTVDAMKMEMTDSVNEAMAVAENGWRVVQDELNKREQIKSQSNLQGIQTQTQAMHEDREDRQRHELDKAILEGMIKAGLLSKQQVADFEAEIREVMRNPPEAAAQNQSPGAQQQPSLAQ